jgi:hypothetical protein
MSIGLASPFDPEIAHYFNGIDGEVQNSSVEI